MGGPNAEITTRESVEALAGIMSTMGLSDSGRFIDIDGTDIPW
jgi:hypothetical protein